MRRNDPCPCGSGRRYKHCCGGLADRSALPPGTAPIEPFLGLPDRVQVVPGFLSRNECSRLLDLATRLRSEEAAVTREQEGKLVTERSAYRVTTVIKNFDQPEAFVPVVARAFREQIEPAFDTRIEWFEWPDVLLYDPGGRYDIHTDSDLRYKQSGQWHRVMDRDLSLLIYLNDDFSGGELEFPSRNRTIRPQAGMLVAFPSDHRFAHAVSPVVSGQRYAIVSWAATVGSPRVHQRRRLLAIYPDRRMLPDQLPVRRIGDAGYLIEPRVPTPA